MEWIKVLWFLNMILVFIVLVLNGIALNNTIKRYGEAEEIVIKLEAMKAKYLEMVGNCDSVDK